MKTITKLESGQFPNSPVSSSESGRVLVHVKRSITAADTGNKLPSKHEKEVIINANANYKMVDHYFMATSSHSLVHSGKLKVGKRYSRQEIEKATGVSPHQDSKIAMVIEAEEV